MSDSRKIVRVFLASPGDLTEERKSARKVIDEINASWADFLGYQVELFGWEDTVATYNRPQAEINRDLARCELFVGMMWKRWGTPPDTTHTYSSGFEEEFSLTVKNRDITGRPEISLFFKDVASDFLKDPGPDLIKVKAFQTKIINEKKIYYQTFGDIHDFETKLRKCVERYIQRLIAEEATPAAESAPADGGDADASSEAAKAASSKSPAADEEVAFLREFASKLATNGEKQGITAVEVARFRLLSSVFKRSGNDTRWLDVHDANLLFVHRSDLNLGRPEMSGLIEAGLRRYSSSNVPLWHWYVALYGNSGPLWWAYTFDAAEVAIGAFAAMRLIAADVDPGAGDRRAIVEHWLAPERTSATRVAALEYLADRGTSADLKAVRAEYDRGDYQTASAALNAILQISLRDSRDTAISTLYDLEPKTVSLSLVKILFANASTISDEVLRIGTTHASSEVRRWTTKLLARRRALDISQAELLLDDESRDVRREAMLALVQLGRTFSKSDAKKLLTKPPSLGFGLFGAGNSDDLIQSFEQERLELLSGAELKGLADEANIFDQQARFELTKRQFAKHSSKLRRALDDRFKTEFEAYVTDLETRFGGAAREILEPTQRMETAVRQGLCRRALDILSARGESEDLARVRSALADNFVAYTDTDMHFLRKHGEWKDIALVIECAGRSAASASGLLTGASKEKSVATGRTIYGLGRARLNELLDLQIPAELLPYVVASIPDSAFKLLPLGRVERLLASEHERVRKVAALKSVRAYSKATLREMLNSHVQRDGTWYYNVVHWLDFGLSLPQNVASAGAGRAISAEFG